MKKNNSPLKRLKIFDFTRDGKGISKSAADMAPGLKRFFVTLRNNLGKIVTVNIFMVVGNFPLIFLICNLSGYFKIPYQLPFFDVFQNLSAIFALDGPMTPYKLVLFGISGTQNQVLASTAVNYVFYALGALGLLTFGIVNVGTAYILRNISSGEPVFPWSDFWYAVKRNYKQAIPFGAIDIIICAILTFNIYLTVSSGTFFLSIMFWSSVVISVLYFFMRYYMYVQMVTFKLSIFKMLKNSLIFALLGIKRNIVALLGIILGVILEIGFMLSGVLVPVAVAAPLILLFSLFAYMKVYAAYFKIKEYLIDPYYNEHPEERRSLSEVETVMHDDVTENERLKKIKAEHNKKSFRK